MRSNKKNLIVVILLSIVLAGIVIYSKDFERILYKYFTAKSTEGSRTPLLVYFMEHMRMVLLSSFIAVTIGSVLGIFVTTKYGSEFKDLLLKTVNLGQSFPSPAPLSLN